MTTFSQVDSGDAGVEIIGEILVQRIDGDDLVDGGDDVEALNGLFGDIMSVAKSVVHSPITKVVAGAAAIAFPPLGVPAAAALVVADRAVTIADGMRHTTPAKRAEVTKAVHHTIALAKMKDAHGAPLHPDALRAAEFMRAASMIRKSQAKKVAHPRAHAKAAAQHGTLLRRNTRTGKLEIVKHPHGWLSA